MYQCMVLRLASDARVDALSYAVEQKLHEDMMATQFNLSLKRGVIYVTKSPQ